MNDEARSSWFPLALRAKGAIAILLALVLTPHRAGDWLFRSDTFDPAYGKALWVLRILLGVGGIALLVFGGKVGRWTVDRWNRSTAAARIGWLTFGLLLLSIGIFAFSRWSQENMIHLGQVEPYKERYKLLGFEVVLATNEFHTPDFISCIFFAMSAALGLSMSLWRPKGTGLRDRTNRFWNLVAVGFGFLLLDEFYGLHEFIGNNWLVKLGERFTHNPDDLVIMAYFVVALIVLIRYRSVFSSRRAAWVTFLLGAVFHGTAVLVDAFGNSYVIEEGGEAVASVLYFGALLQVASAEVQSMIQRTAQR
jgi:hypothetical protein